MIVAVAEDGGGDFDLIAEDALGGITTVIDGGLDLFDDDSLATFAGLHLRCNSFAVYTYCFIVVLIDRIRCGGDTTLEAWMCIQLRAAPKCSEEMPVIRTSPFGRMH